MTAATVRPRAATLILGNSHAAGLWRAIRDTAPDCRFWGLPGGSFARARTGADGLIAPDPKDRRAIRQVAEWNDTPGIDPTRFTRILVVGLRFRLRPVLELAESVALAEDGPRAGLPVASRAFLRAAIAALVRADLADHVVRMPADGRMTFMPAPYPAARSHRKGPLHEPLLAAAARRPDAARLMDLFEGEIARALAERGLAFAPQPRQTLAGPFTTRDAFLADPARDARHMNDAWGRIAWAELDRRPAAPRAP